jgi:hypothetical protein
MEGWFSWGPSWGWGVALIVCTVALHVTCIVSIALRLRTVRLGETRVARPFLHTTAGAITVIVVVAWLLAALHGIECAIWAILYLRLDAIPAPAAAMLYSVDALTTRGASSGLTLKPQWQMLGAIESINGLLLFGISTAFLFHVMRSWLPDLRPDLAGYELREGDQRPSR